MSDWSIISPLTETVDRRGDNFARGLGNAPVSPIAAGVQGLQEGLDFGVNLSGKIQRINRENDPETLAAEKLRNELANQELQESIRKRKLDNELTEEFGREAMLSDINFKNAQSMKMLTGDPGDELEDQERRERIKKMQLERSEKIRENTPISDEEVAALAAGKSYTPSAPEEPADFSGVGAPPRAQPRPAPVQIDTSDPQTTAELISQQLAAKQKATNSYVHSLAKQALPMETSYDETGALRMDISGLPDEAMKDGGKPLQAPVALATLSQLTNVHKTLKTPEDAKQVADVAAYVFDRVSIGDMEEFIKSAPDDTKQYLRKQKDAAAAMIASYGNPAYLSQEQKAIQAAELPFSSLIDPEGTYKEAMSLISEGFTATNNLDLKNSLRDNQYFAALGQASKNGTQPVTIREIPSPPQNQGVSADLTNTAPPPPTMTEFRGADGTVVLTPTPVVNKNAPDPEQQRRMGQLSFAETVAAQQKDIISVNTQVAADSKQAQDAREQGAFQRPATTGAPKIQEPQETPEFEPPSSSEEYMHPEWGKKLSPSVSEFGREAIIEQEVLRQKGAITPKNKADILKDAGTTAEKRIKAYNKDMEPVAKGLEEATETMGKSTQLVSKMNELVEAAKEDEDLRALFGKQGAAVRAGLEKVGIVKGVWNYLTNDELSDTEKKQLAMLEKMKAIESEGFLDSVKPGQSTMANTNVEQLRLIKAKFNMDTPFERLQELAADAKMGLESKTNVNDFRSMLIDRGLYIGKTEQARLARHYEQSGQSKPFIVKKTPGEEPEIVPNPDYRTPEEYLFGVKKKKEAPAAAAAPTGGEPPAPAGGTPSAGTPPAGSTPPPAEGVSTQKKSIAEAYLPSWLSESLTVDNFKRGLNDLAVGNDALIADPLGSAAKLITGTKNAAIEAKQAIEGGTPEERAAQKQSIVKMRSEQDPEFRRQVDEAKMQIGMRDERVKFFDMVVDHMTPEAVKNIGANLEKNADEVLNKALLFVGTDPATVDKWQQQRDVRRTAEQEAVQDEGLEHPWENAGAAVAGFAILNSVVNKGFNMAGKAAAKQLLKIPAPFVQNAILGLQKLAQKPVPAGVLKRVPRTTSEATTYALQKDTGEFGDNLAAGAAMSLIGNEIIAPAASGAFRAGKEATRKISDAIGKPVAQQSPAEALASASYQRGVKPDIYTGAADKADLISGPGYTGRAAGMLDDNAAETLRDVTATPSAQRGISDSFDNEIAATRGGLRKSTGLDNAPSIEAVTAPAQQSVRDQIATGRGQLQAGQTIDQARELRANTAATKAAEQSRAQAVSGAGSRIVQNLDDKANAAIAELSEVSGATPELKPVTKGGSSNPARAARQSSRSLETVQQNLQAAYKPAYKELFESNPTLNEKAVEGLYDDLLATGGQSFRDLVKEVNRKSGYDVDDFMTMKNDVNWLDNLHREIRLAASKRYAGPNKVGADVAKNMQRQIEDFLDDHFETFGTAGEKKYSNLINKYRNVRQLEDSVLAQKKITDELHSRLAVSQKKTLPTNFENRFLERSDDLAALTEEMGEAGVKEFRESMQALDRANTTINEMRKAASKIGKSGKIKDADVLALSDDLAAAHRYVGDHQFFGEALLDIDNPGFIEKVKRGIGDPTIVEDGMRRAMANRMSERASTTATDSLPQAMGFSKKQWTNVKAALPPDEVKALETIFARAQNLEKSVETVSRKADRADFGRMEKLPASTIGWKYKATNTFLDLFRSQEMRGLTRTEQTALARALTDSNPATVNRLIRETAEVMKKREAGSPEFPLQKWMTALGVGYDTQPSEDAKDRRKETRKKLKSLKK